ncbi:hypothetical protein KIPB_011863, partial [Kipferlia bialata]
LLFSILSLSTPPCLAAFASSPSLSALRNLVKGVPKFPAPAKLEVVTLVGALSRRHSTRKVTLHNPRVTHNVAALPPSLTASLLKRDGMAACLRFCTPNAPTALAEEARAAVASLISVPDMDISLVAETMFAKGVLDVTLPAGQQ